MSLLNQMLRDLEQRRASSEERGTLPEQVRALPPPRAMSQATGMLPWILGAVLVVAAGSLAWWWKAAPSAAPETVAEQPAPASTQAAPAPGARLTYEIAHPPARHAASSTSSVASAQPTSPLASAAAMAHPQGAARSSIVVSAANPMAPGAAPVSTALPASPPARPAAEAPGETRIAKEVHELTPAERAENEFRRGNTLLAQGQTDAARAAYEAALMLDAAHGGARQALLGLLIQAHDYPAAERVLNDGLALNPAQPGLALALAHLQVERGDSAAALSTLAGAEGEARGNADYLAFMAALYERGGDHARAADHYQSALALRPQSGVWLMGLGMALQGLNRNAEAREAYQRAQASNSLTPELQAYVTQRLGQIP